jgi:deazaflavin-dependent oxidoreductase (nitroreductase family)
MAAGHLLKRVLALPVRLYDIRLGWVLGHRFLLLAHRGRTTGRLYRVVLEVVAWRPETRKAVVMSGFGVQSNWYRNVLASGQAEVTIGRDRFRAAARPLDPDAASAVFSAYEQRNRVLRPLLRAVLSRQAGLRYDGSDEARQRLLQVLPLVSLCGGPPGG